MRAFLLLLSMSMAVSADSIVLPLGPHLARDTAIHSGLPGHPRLPEIILTVALPPGADLSSVRARLHSLVIESVPSPTLPLNPPIAVLGGRMLPSPVEPYDPSKPFPTRFADIASTGMLGDVPIVRIRLFPLRLTPPTAERLADGRLVLEYVKGPAPAAPRVPKTGKTYFDAAANAEQAARWFSFRSEGKKMVVIVSRTLRERSRLLEPYVEAMRNAGWTMHVRDVESFTGGSAGQARSEAMRQIIRAYVAEGLTHVLLIGNPDPLTGEVPMKITHPLKDSLVGDAYTKDTPTDFYYAELSGNWDLNGDGKYGRIPEDHRPGGADAFPEVVVGRIPVYHGQAAELDDYLNRLLWFQSRPQPVSRPFLLPNSVVFLPGEGGAGLNLGDGANLGEEFSRDVLSPAGVPFKKLYEKEGLSPSPHACDLPLTEENLLSLWKDGAGGVLWFGHGGMDIVVRTIWAWDDGDGRAEEAEGEKEQKAFMVSRDAWTVDPAMPPMVFAVACENAHPEYDANLAARLLRTSAVASCGATRWASAYMVETDFVEHDSAGGIGFRFFQNLITQGMDAGSALLSAKTDPGLDYDEQPFWWQNIYGYNLYGDPTLPYRGGLLEGAAAEPDVYWVRAEPEALVSCGGDLLLTVKGNRPGLSLSVPGADGLGASEVTINELGDGTYQALIRDAKPLAGHQNIAVALGDNAVSGAVSSLPTVLLDPPGNVEGEYRIPGLDILETSVRSEGAEIVFTLRVAGGFSEPGDFRGEGFYTAIWWMDGNGDGEYDWSLRHYMYQGDEWSIAVSEPDYADRRGAAFTREGDLLTIRLASDFFPEGTRSLAWQIWTYAVNPSQTRTGYQIPPDWAGMCLAPSPAMTLAPIPAMREWDLIAALNPGGTARSLAVLLPYMGKGKWTYVDAHASADLLWEEAGPGLVLLGTETGLSTFALDREHFRCQPAAAASWTAGDRAFLPPPPGRVRLANLGRANAVIHLGGADLCLLPNTVEEIEADSPMIAAVVSGDGVFVHWLTEDGVLPVFPSSRTPAHGWLSGAAHVAGYGGTLWKSRLVMLNVGDSDTQVRVTLHKGGWAAGSSSRTESLPVGQARTVEDVLTEWFGAEGFGTLEVEASSPVLAYLQTSAEGEEGRSQLIPMVADGSGLTGGDRFTLPESLSALNPKVFWTNPGPDAAMVGVGAAYYALAPGAVVWMPVAPGEEIRVESGRVYPLLSFMDSTGRPASVTIGSAAE